LKFQLHFTIRKFEKEDNEDKDSGYYDDLNHKTHGKIDINIDDNAFEQILTIYHEITHFIFDFICQYKLDTEHKKYIKCDNTLKKEWRKHNAEMEDRRKDQKGVEELICSRIEKAIAPIFRKHIPKSFFKKFFK
jgi:hypothetical protein